MVLSRVMVIARNVFLEVIRDRILYLVALFALLMVAATLLLPPSPPEPKIRSSLT